MFLFQLQVFLYLTSALLVCSAFSIVSVLTILGFITVQYFAVCKPLQYIVVVQKTWVTAFIFISWIVTITVSFIPFVWLLFMTRGDVCDASLLSTILQVVIIGSDCCIALIALIYISVLVLCALIYNEIHNLQKRLSYFQYIQDVKAEQKTFVTTVLLMAALTVFNIPYTIVYIVSLHNSDGADINNSILIYYMNMLPYMKFLSDPLIYSLRMKEIREGCARFAFNYGCQMCCDTSSERNMLAMDNSSHNRTRLEEHPNICVQLIVQKKSCTANIVIDNHLPYQHDETAM